MIMKPDDLEIVWTAVFTAKVLTEDYIGLESAGIATGFKVKSLKVQLTECNKALTVLDRLMA
jgi:hypothetical protein